MFGGLFIVLIRFDFKVLSEYKNILSNHKTSFTFLKIPSHDITYLEHISKYDSVFLHNIINWP